MSDQARQHLDPGTRHVLAWCTSCPPWRELQASRSDGYEAAARHAELVHGDKQAAKELRRRARDTR